jgi:hypothetical protein
MALKVRDRVKETTTTTGTGTITLGGAVTGFRTFSSVLSDNDTTYYAIVGDTQFEVGLGTYSSNTLARTTVLSSSNSNSAVSFSTGTKNVFITQPSGKAVFRDASGNIAELTTANLSENTNLYYTDERVDDRISALFQSGTGISFSYNDSSNTFTPTVTLSPFDTDNLSEGSSNLYFTNERVDDRVASLLQNGTGISFTYNDSSNTLTPVISLSSFDTDNLSEGSSNLYHTTERVQDIVGAMFSSNTETGITVSYEDSDGTIDLVVATQSDNNFTTTLLNKLNAIESNATADQTASEIRTLVESASDSNVFTDADHSKLDGIEASATADQTAAEIRTLVESASDSNVFTDADHTKLNGIEASATADQSDSEIKTAYENNSDTNAFTDALLSKLNAIESGATADQTSEEIQDIVGAMFSSNTETGLTATYQDSDGTIDLVVSLSSFDTDNLSEGSSNLYYTDARVNSFLTTNSYATQSFVNTAISNLVDSAPSTLDTLNELAAALGDDANFSTTTATSLGNRLRIDVSNQGLTSTQKTNALTNLGINSEYSGNSATATALATARTIHGVSFDGTANIDLSEVIQDTVGAMFSGNTETNITATYEDSDGTIDLVVATLNQDTTGNSATATALETARTIHGVSFDGTANIDLSEVIQDTVGAMFSSNTETGITATYEDSDGTIDLVVATQTANDFTTTLKNKLDGIEASATADQSDSEIKTAYENNSDTNAFTDALLSKLNGIEANATADQTAEEIQDIVGAMFSSNTETGITATYQDSDGTIDLVVGTLNQDTTGNSATATALETARTIHGVSFDGTANIDLSEVIQDTVGAMFSSNTETGITATYQDADGTIDLVVATLNQDTTGNSATATALETARTIHGVSFDGTANIDLTEVIQDTVGAMVSSNTESGISVTYQDSDGTLDFSVSGGAATSMADADSDTKIQVEESSDEDIIRFDTAGVERMTIGNTGIVNIKSPHADTNGGGQIILQPTDATDSDDENYGSIEFQNSSNTTLAKISGVSEGSGDNKGHLRFSTKSGSGALTQQMLIRDNGLIQIGAAVSMSSTLSVASGLTLSGDSSSADALDDYEEGEFTPTGNNVTFTGAGGHYTKVGNRVWVTFYVQFPTTSDGNTIGILSLPFTNKNHDSGQNRANANRGAFTVGYSNSGQQLRFVMNNGTTSIFAHNFDGNAVTNSQASGKAIYGGGFYEVA